MYPTLYDMFLDLFGLSIPFLRVVQSFGFFVAISFVLAYITMSSELKRKEKLGLIKSQKVKTLMGKPYAKQEYVVSALMGFLLGYKIVPVLIFSSNMDDPRSFLLSTEGYPILGFALAVAMVLYKRYEDKKQQLHPPVEKDITVRPHHHMSNLTMVAAITGLLGAKIFHNLENWSYFISNPIDALFSFSGLTFFGGLICGGAGVLWYANKKGIKPLHMLDVGAPAMMLAYASGRIGCHVSGDGDWGIVNTADKPSWLSWAPDWFWAYNYPNNVNQQCNPYVEGSAEYIENRFCNFEETPYLIANVFPTPLYEILVCGLFFGLLWFLRKRINIPGMLFGIYMILAGFERFWIEKIRVNTLIDFLGMQVTQAEIISTLMMLLGIAMIIYTKKRHTAILNKTA